MSGAKVKRESEPEVIVKGYDMPERTTLPALKSKVKVNVFKVLKDAIGSDLMNFCVPVYFNEPLSML